MYIYIYIALLHFASHTTACAEIHERTVRRHLGALQYCSGIIP